MTPAQHGTQQTQGDFSLTSPAGVHAQVALEQSALYASRLAIARWINGSSAHSLPADNGARRAQWFAEAHGHFQEWLSEGGFARADDHLFDAPGAAFTPPLQRRTPDTDSQCAGCLD